MNIEKVLTRLEKVKSIGGHKWTARCPAHVDKNPSLAVRVADDRILLHCFSGCEVPDIVAAIGLELSDLFPERIKSNWKPVKFDAYQTLQCLKTEATIIMLAAADCANQIPFSEETLSRIIQAKERIDEACCVVWGRR